EERFDVDLTCKPAIDELRHLRPALDPAERAARNAPAGDQEARDHFQHLAFSGDAADRRETPRLARGLDGLPHDRDVAGRLERVVGAEATSLAADPVDGVVSRSAHVRGAVVTRLREPLFREVERDDALRTGEPRADHGSE